MIYCSGIANIFPMIAVLKKYNNKHKSVAIAIVDRRTTTISRYDSSVFPCFERKTKRALFNPKEEKKLRFPNIVTRANTPYASSPKRFINIGTHTKVSIATAINCKTPNSEFFIRTFFCVIFLLILLFVYPLFC